MSESLILNLFVCLFVFFFYGRLKNENDCFRACLIFHFINFLPFQGVLAWNFLVTSVVVVVL